MKINNVFFFALLTSFLLPACSGSPGQTGFSSEQCSNQDIRVLEQIKSYNSQYQDVFHIGHQKWDNGQITHFTAVDYGDKFRLRDLFQLASLQELNLSYVDILDSMTADIDNLRRLESLIINFTNLSGNINVGIGTLDKLVFLSLDHNNLTGTLPESLENLTLLKGLSLDHNQLSGELPDAIGNWTNLTHLHLDENNFSGEIPSSVGNMKKLKVLHLAYNQFETLPEAICGLPLAKMEFTLYGNRFCNDNSIPKCTAGMEGFQNCY